VHFDAGLEASMSGSVLENNFYGLFYNCFVCVLLGINLGL
jgi:hypothetical protein